MEFTGFPVGGGLDSGPGIPRSGGRRRSSSDTSEEIVVIGVRNSTPEYDTLTLDAGFYEFRGPWFHDLIEPPLAPPGKKDEKKKKENCEEAQKQARHAARAYRIACKEYKNCKESYIAIPCEPFRKVWRAAFMECLDAAETCKALQCDCVACPECPQPPTGI